MPRDLTKKWIIKTIPLKQYGEAVALRIDPQDGMFWFEFPEGSGNQYAGCDRGAMTAGITKVVRAHYHQVWTQHIVVRELAPYYRTETPPSIGFRELARYERSIIELDVPRVYDRGNQSSNATQILRAQKEGKTDDYRWVKAQNTSYRPFPGDADYLLTDHGLSECTRDGSRKVFDYSEDLWTRLLMIFHACTDMHRRLRDLMDGPADEVQERILETIGPGRLLGDGS